MKVLVIAPCEQGELHSSLGAVITAAHQLSPKAQVHAVVFEGPEGEGAKRCALYAGVAQVICVRDRDFEGALAPEWVVPTLVHLAKDYDVILTSANTFGKNIMPSLAAQLDVGQFSDVTAILGPNRFVRPMYAGNALEEVETVDDKVLLTIRAIAFEGACLTTSPAPIVEVPLVTAPLKGKVAFLKLESSIQSRPDLLGADVVVAGGRGVGSRADFKLIEQLADCLGGAVGASRAAVDAGFVTNDCQVGQTGKVVAPKLYVAIGISGAVQHWSGMKESKVIVAINQDPEAPICQMADFVLVADLFKAVPELIEALGKEKGGS